MTKHEYMFTFTGLDGKEYKFIREPNMLNSNHMWTINDWRYCYAGTKREVNQVERDIKNNCQWKECNK